MILVGLKKGYQNYCKPALFLEKIFDPTLLVIFLQKYGVLKFLFRKKMSFLHCNIFCAINAEAASLIDTSKLAKYKNFYSNFLLLKFLHLVYVSLC